MLPSNKVSAGVLAGALTTILVWLVDELAAVTVPPEVAAALTVLLSGLAGYIVPEHRPAPSQLDHQAGHPPRPPRG